MNNITMKIHIYGYGQNNKVSILVRSKRTGTSFYVHTWNTDMLWIGLHIWQSVDSLIDKFKKTLTPCTLFVPKSFRIPYWSTQDRSYYNNIHSSRFYIWDGLRSWNTDWHSGQRLPTDPVEHPTTLLGFRNSYSRKELVQIWSKILYTRVNISSEKSFFFSP